MIDIGIVSDHPDLINQLWTGNCLNEAGSAWGECLSGYNAADNNKLPTPYGTDYH